MQFPAFLADRTPQLTQQHQIAMPHPFQAQRRPVAQVRLQVLFEAFKPREHLVRVAEGALIVAPAAPGHVVVVGGVRCNENPPGKGGVVTRDLAAAVSAVVAVVQHISSV